MADRYAEILVVDLLGGIGDLIMLLPAIHGLARRHPAARLRVLTHEPGAELVRPDPAVAEVRTPRHGRPGAERAAVVEALAARRPDLAVTTTRYDGIPDLLLASGARCVTDLWRRPPPDEPVGARYLRLLHAEGLLTRGDLTARPRVRLPASARAAGEGDVDRLVAAARRSTAPPVVLVTAAGMAVKRWPDGSWRALAGRLAAAGHPVLTVGADDDPPGVPLPPGDLPTLAGQFAAVARRGGVVVGPDTGPVRLAAAAGATTVGLFGPTDARRYGVGGLGLQGLPQCPHRRPTAITEQPCWWEARCPLDAAGPACMADLGVNLVTDAVRAATRRPSLVWQVPTG
ncbi:glycosyltransferase family 9 protein [Micromonospora sagamiensis]|uniref:ADP-heptose:LPS heptosyltransferase n=1 Tax=Micromonospora sagamiensis TaxID=47875 RepID=A0A562WK32_9ACTN|nr:glycosyltransferase family 9 protein [Micromonospora sagamiensis]TWJ29894.1 ADP-heptose:LPS heptosyltransferase [Micromonospora sagamiensis]BCL17076.1 glycosyl transferase [Micromonospora sagamiensis]